jgi:M6 family metalloprotease-like protein
MRMFNVGKINTFLVCLALALFCMISPFALPAAIADTGPSQPLAGDKKPAGTNLRVIVILAEFPDARHQVSREAIKKRIFTDVNDYYREATYGLVTITGDVVPDWIMMSRPMTSYGDFTRLIGSDVLDREFKLAFDLVRAADDRVDFKQYDKVIVIIPPVLTVNFALMQPIQTNDGINISWVTVQREDMSAGIIAHELGHALGLPDLYDLNQAENERGYGSGAIYMGPWCLMSMGNGEHFCGFSKIMAGWIPDERIVQVSAGSRKWVSLEPLEIKTGGTQIIKIFKTGQSKATDAYYIVEARNKIGYDKILPDEGILVTAVDETKAVRNYGTVLMAPAGFIKLMKPDSDSRDLNHATFNLGTGKNNVFKDPGQDLAVVVVNAGSRAYDIVVTTLGDADKIASYAAQLYRVRMDLEAAGTQNPSAAAKVLFDQARVECESCLNNLRSSDPVLATEKLDKISGLISNAIAVNNSYHEAERELKKAEQAVQDAEKDGRNGGLDQARKQLGEAGQALSSADYEKAVILAVRARRTAETSLSFMSDMVRSVMRLFKGTEAPGASFEVISMDIAPLLAMAGQEITVAARVANIGDAPGTFRDALTVDGKEAAKGDLMLKPGSIATLDLKFIPVSDGKLNISFAGLSQIVVVKKLIDKEVELKYDNGKVREMLSSGAGYIIDFSPPATPFTLKKVKIFGMLSPKAEKGSENTPFELRVLDTNMKLIYTSATTYSKFSGDAAWVNFEFPDLQINERFYIFLDKKNTDRTLLVGVDDSVVNEHSDIAFRDSEGIVRRYRNGHPGLPVRTGMTIKARSTG